jgi:cystathionine beta-synthase
MWWFFRYFTTTDVLYIGTAVYAAIQAAKSLKKGQRCVVILPDSIRNYMSKHLNDGWMKENGFTDEYTEKNENRVQWNGATIKDLDLPVAVTVEENIPCKEAVKIMESNGFDQLPVISASGKLLGLVTLGILYSVSFQEIFCPKSPLDVTV